MMSSTATNALRAVGAHKVARVVRPKTLGRGFRNMRRAMRDYKRAMDLGTGVSADLRAKEIQARTGRIFRRVVASAVATLIAGDFLGVVIGAEDNRWGLMLALAVFLVVAIVVADEQAGGWTIYLTAPAALAGFTYAAFMLAHATVLYCLMGGLALWVLGFLAVLVRFAWDDGSVLDDLGIGVVVPASAGSKSDVALLAVAKAIGIDVERYPDRVGGLALARPVERTEDGGWRCSVRLPLGRSAGEVDETIVASVLGILPRQVETSADTSNVNVIDLTVYGVDPETIPSDRPPLILRPRRTSVFDPCRLGKTTSGPLMVPIIGQSFLFGGMPGFGKSVGAFDLLTHILMDPASRLFVADGKVIDTQALQPVAERWTGDDIASTADMLEHVETLMAANKAALVRLGLSRISPAAVEAGVRPVFVYMDELNSFIDVGGPDAKHSERIKRSLKRLIEQGRALGVVVVLVTQNPNATNTPSEIRDLIKIRVAVKTAQATASNAILGDGSKGEGWSSHTLMTEGSAIVSDRGRYHRARLDHFDTETDTAGLVAFALDVRGRFAAPMSELPTSTFPTGIVADVAAVFAAQGVDRVTSAELALALGMDMASLADALRPWGVSPRDIRTGKGTKRGYMLADLRNARWQGCDAPHDAPRDGDATVSPLHRPSQDRRARVAPPVAPHVAPPVAGFTGRR